MTECDGCDATGGCSPECWAALNAELSLEHRQMRLSDFERRAV